MPGNYPRGPARSRSPYAPWRATLTGPMLTGMGPTVMNRLHALLVWALWGVVVALVAVIALGLVANVL